MAQFVKTGILALGIFVMLVPRAEGSEEDVLSALEKVQAAVEADASHAEMVKLLGSAKAELDALGTGVGPSCFQGAARRSYDWYALGVRSRASLLENQRQRDRHARQAQYGEHRMKGTSLKLAENYDRLVAHARKELPSKWEHGHVELQKARECLARKEHRRRR